ncbi:hypothetical protein MNB_SV-13-407 [hydrothermal vent metagenome]|uniref:Uncharacterized protein n=1 Tax=hydrothermal vent metagenome TaxID=652676 RepID=A0A1W1BHJ3_9ZZZZ
MVECINSLLRPYLNASKKLLSQFISSKDSNFFNSLRAKGGAMVFFWEL